MECYDLRIAGSLGGKSSSEVLSKNEPSVFLRMLKVLSSCVTKDDESVMFMQGWLYESKRDGQNATEKTISHCLIYLYLLFQWLFQLGNFIISGLFLFRYHNAFLLPWSIRKVVEEIKLMNSGCYFLINKGILHDNSSSFAQRDNIYQWTKRSQHPTSKEYDYLILPDEITLLYILKVTLHCTRFTTSIYFRNCQRITIR